MPGTGIGSTSRWVSALRLASASTRRIASAIQARSSVDVFGTTRLLEAFSHPFGALLDVESELVAQVGQQEDRGDRRQDECHEQHQQVASWCPTPKKIDATSQTTPKVTPNTANRANVYVRNAFMSAA